MLTCEWVPGSAIGDALVEGGRVGLAGLASVHGFVVGRVGEGEVFEDIVVGRERGGRRVALEHCGTFVIE